MRHARYDPAYRFVVPIEPGDAERWEFTSASDGIVPFERIGRAQLGVAHKTAPCGTVIQFTYAGRALRVAVIDRGPYIAGREWDLTGAAADALGFPGLGAIAWSVATG